MSRGGISLVRAAIVIVVLVLVVAAIVVFVWSPFTTGSKSTTSTVSAAASLVAAVQPAPQTACGGRTFSNSSLSINWGNLAPGTEGIQYLCLRNTGVTAIKLAVSSSLSPSIGRVTSPQAGSTLIGGGIIEVELDLWVSSNVQPGPMSAFTIALGASS